MSTINKRQPCPCGSGARLSRCCWPLIMREQQAVTAEQLMRSRFSAYSLNIIDYIVDTTHPAQQPKLDLASMIEWAQTSRWHKLTVQSTKAGGADDNDGVVEFIAEFSTADDKRIQKHHERSTFVRVDGQWYFVDPNTPL